MDRHRFEADPNPSFHFDADPDPAPDPDATPSYVGKSDFYFYSQQCQFTLFHLSLQCHRSHNFQYFGHSLKLSG